MEGKIPIESIHERINLDGLTFSFSRQKTPANCGPLSVSNSLHFLESLRHVEIPEGFRSSFGIRKKMAEIRGDKSYESNDKWTDNFLLMEIMNKISFLKYDESNERYFSDINIFLTRNHFFSIVKNANQNLILLDSLRKPEVIGNAKNFLTVKAGYEFVKNKFGEVGSKTGYEFNESAPKFKIVEKNPKIKIIKNNDTR